MKQEKELLEKLHPLEEKEKVWRTFRQDRRRFVGKGAALAGALFLLAGICYTCANLELRQGSLLQRNGYGGGEKQVSLRARVESREESIPLTLTVEEQRYQWETILELQKEAEKALKELYLGKNESPDCVRSPLVLPESVEGYPFTLEWESSDELLLSSQGKPGIEIPESGAAVTLTVTYRYGDFSCFEQIPLRIYPPLVGIDQLEKEKLVAAAQEAVNADPEKGQIHLPTQLEGKAIVWQQDRRRIWYGLVFLWIAVCTALYLSRKEKIHREVQKRDRQLAEAYPEIVSKISLLLEAGLPIKQIFFRIRSEYEKKVLHTGATDYAYEEIYALCREMEQGIPEREAYRRWGMRMGQASYRRLVSLLLQNMRRGTAALKEQLQEEVQNAWEERKARAKQKGEEAGTKLLLPMMGMLIVVLALLMIPAYFTFLIT